MHDMKILQDELMSRLNVDTIDYEEDALDVHVEEIKDLAK